MEILNNIKQILKDIKDKTGLAVNAFRIQDDYVIINEGSDTERTFLIINNTVPIEITDTNETINEPFRPRFGITKDNPHIIEKINQKNEIDQREIEQKEEEEEERQRKYLEMIEKRKYNSEKFDKDFPTGSIKFSIENIILEDVPTTLSDENFDNEFRQLVKEDFMEEFANVNKKQCMKNIIELLRDYYSLCVVYKQNLLTQNGLIADEREGKRKERKKHGIYKRKYLKQKELTNLYKTQLDDSEYRNEYMDEQYKKRLDELTEELAKEKEKEKEKEKDKQQGTIIYEEGKMTWVPEGDYYDPDEPDYSYYMSDEDNQTVPNETINEINDNEKSLTVPIESINEINDNEKSLAVPIETINEINDNIKKEKIPNEIINVDEDINSIEIINVDDDVEDELVELPIKRINFLRKKEDKKKQNYVLDGKKFKNYMDRNKITMKLLDHIDDLEVKQRRELEEEHPWIFGKSQK